MSPITSEEKAVRVAQICDEQKGQDIAVLKVGDICSFTDYLVVATGLSDTHVRSLCETVNVALKKDDEFPLGIEGGDPSSGWVLMDYGDVVVHLFLAERRLYYNLERLWGDGVRVDPFAAAGA